MGIKTGKKSGSGSKKYGRNQRKRLARLNPISLFVRNRISFESYLKRTGIRSPRK